MAISIEYQGGAVTGGESASVKHTFKVIVEEEEVKNLQWIEKTNQVYPAMERAGGHANEWIDLFQEYSKSDYSPDGEEPIFQQADECIEAGETGSFEIKDMPESPLSAGSRTLDIIIVMQVHKDDTYKTYAAAVQQIIEVDESGNLQSSQFRYTNFAEIAESDEKDSGICVPHLSVDTEGKKVSAKDALEEYSEVSLDWIEE